MRGKHRPPGWADLAKKADLTGKWTSETTLAPGTASPTNQMNIKVVAGKAGGKVRDEKEPVDRGGRRYQGSRPPKVQYFGASAEKPLKSDSVYLVSKEGSLSQMRTDRLEKDC